MENALSNGYKAVAIPFKSVGTVVDGKRGVYLTQIIPLGADKMTTTENTVQLQTLNEGGKGGTVYTYHKGEDPDDRYFSQPGWYQNRNKVGTSKAPDQFYPEGTGLWVSGPATAIKFQTSGEVELDTVNTDLVSGYRLVANPYPTTIKLTNIIPTGVDKMTTTENTVQIQTLNTEGKGGTVYTYHKGEDPDDRYFSQPGWYQNRNKVGTSKAPDPDIPAGTALWVSSQSSAISVNIVTPFEDFE